MEETTLFCEEMKEAQKAAMEKQWKEFKKRMMEKPENILKQFDLFGNTAIHVATRSNPQLLTEFIEMVPVQQRWDALCKKNVEGNTVLHELVFSKKAREMAVVVFRFEDQLLTPRKEPLLELRNNRGETPLFVAAMHGKQKILKYMAERVGTMNLGKHFRRSDKYNALHASVIGQHFHVAIWLERNDEKLALEKDEKDLTSLQLLFKMPQVFRSHTHIGPFKSTIYLLLPDGYDNDEHSLLFKQKKDEENGKEDDEPTLCKSDKGRTVLHEVAIMDYYKEEHLAGVAFHLQNELRWYDSVRRFIPKNYNMHCDIDGHTPENTLEIEHDEMLKEAQKWLKGTAQSCSTIAILVATVVFAAAYTIPGGTQNGTPVFLHSSVFLLFTIMDVVALAPSLASVVIFLSILTSPCELWDFHKSLPRKLNLGFALLFFSLMTTMLAIIQFPIYVMARSITKHLWKQLKKFFPTRLIQQCMGHT
ncbi:hypothetical protein VNO80_01812 [Phaseolus coccineus]|uniref:PGG domain-containing protein n=1 Tax=Phaseolus coccineus TaxID=3886 RepID=A0AAN9WXK6_PHACN